jgi:phytoene/squalene synthetase
MDAASDEAKLDLEWNYKFLGKTSRSFAMVIRALGDELRDAVSVLKTKFRCIRSIH